MDFAPCPKCGAFNAPDAAACSECRSPLDAEPDAPATPLALKAEPETPLEEPPEARPEPAAPDPLPAFDAAPDILAKVAKLEADLAQKPQAKALYLQLAQIYVDGKRNDLAAAVIERGLAFDPNNVYFRHRLGQVTGRPEPKAPAGGLVAQAATVQHPAARLPRPATPPARAGAGRLPRNRAIAVAAALLAIAVGVKLVVFPSTKLLVAGDFRAFAPVWSPTGKHLAFLIEDVRGAHLAVFDFASGEHRVAGDVPMADVDAFSWSPDGKSIAYAGQGNENDWTGEIRVYDVGTGQSKKLAPGSSPRWRTGGSLLAVCGPERPAAFDGSDDGAASYDWQNRFCRIDADTGAVTRTALAADYGMVLSPMIDRVVFERYAETAAVENMSAGAGGDGEFQDMADAVLAGKAENVAEGARDLNRELEARRYMDKRKAARSTGRVPDMELFAADVDRGEAVRLAAAGEAAYPSWTAAGDRILYAANGSSGVEFWTMGEDGSDRKAVLTGVKGADPSSVRLSPDGKHVFFVARVEGDPGLAKLMTGEEPADLHVAPVGGGTVRRLSNKHSFKHRFALSPDGKRIAYEVLQDVKMLSGEGKSEIWLMNR
jgi:Tol biopolymer transport system component